MKSFLLPTLAAALLAPVALAADKDSTDKAAPKDKPYPLEICLISDESLGEMGEPYVLSYKGQEIKFCCKGCDKDFAKEPAKYLKKMEKLAAEKEKAKKPAK